MLPALNPGENVSGAWETARTVLRRHLPIVVGLAAAGLLFLFVRLNTLNALSANTDHPTVGYDFFGFPRCGLAIRFGTNPFRASQDYPMYGPWATPWVTHPTLCLAAVPLSYLPPWTAFWTFNAANLMLHAAIIIVFGMRLARRDFLSQPRSDQVRDLIFFAAMGLFMPWYVMYYMGQYHSFAVLALFLVLASPTTPVLGFVISALAKPVLAPAGLVLMMRQQWRAVVLIGVLVAAGTLPWMYMHYSVPRGLSFGRNHILDTFLETSQQFTKYTAYRWNQQMSLSAALDEWMPSTEHLKYRYMLAAFTVGVGVVLFRRKQMEVAVAACTLWFFFLYGRGHEYHGTLYVPLLLCLYSLEGERYRGWPLVVIGVLMALPTTYGLFNLFYPIENRPPFLSYESSMMVDKNRALYYLFLWQKPLCAFLLLGLMLWKERPYQPWERAPWSRRMDDRFEPAAPAVSRGASGPEGSR